MHSLQLRLLLCSQQPARRTASTSVIANHRSCSLTALFQSPFLSHLWGRFILEAVGNILSKNRKELESTGRTLGLGCGDGHPCTYWPAPPIAINRPLIVGWLSTTKSPWGVSVYQHNLRRTHGLSASLGRIWRSPSRRASSASSGR